MTPRKATSKTGAKPEPAAPKRPKSAAQSAEKPPGKRTESAPKPTKLVRKGRQLTAGAKLRRDLSWKTADAAAQALLTRIERTANRLEVLGRLLDGDPNAWMAVRIDGQVAEVRVDGAMVEERQLSEVLRKLIGDIQKMKATDDASYSGNEQQATDPVAVIVAAHYGGKRT